MHTSTIHFCGGAGAVTGSNFLLDTGGSKFLIDCGLAQGRHSAEEENWAPFSYEAKDISVLVVTHAHIDHVGRIPLLVKRGFRGRIFSTEATKALAAPLLMDSMELLRFAAQRQGREELYNEDDISQALSQWEVTTFRTPIDMGDGVSLQFLNSGHILGSGMAQFTRDGKAIVFTGDLGGGNSPLLSLAEDPASPDYLVMESVYGDRVRSGEDNRLDHLENIIENSVSKGGTLLIPAFSTERTQDLLFEIRQLMMEKRIPSIPVYIDSPLAQKITDAYVAHPQYFSKEIRARVEGGEHIFAFPELHFVHDVSESRRVHDAANPKIVIAGSGMSNGGRVQSHEAAVLPDSKSSILIVGYQAAGSLGRRLVEGATKVDISRQTIDVHAKVESMYGYSAHMDSEQLLEFANKAGEKGNLKEIFVVMGEPSSASFLAQRIRDYLGVKATTPEVGEEARIEF